MWGERNGKTSVQIEATTISYSEAQPAEVPAGEVRI